MKSILSRLLLYNATVMIAIHLLSFTVLYFVYSAGLRQNFDHVMLRKLELMVQSQEFQRILDPTISNEERNELEDEINRSFYLVAEKSHPFLITYLQIWNDQGDVIFRSESLGPKQDLCHPDQFPSQRPPEYRSIEIDDGSPASLVIVNLRAGDPRFVDLFPTQSFVRNPDVPHTLPKQLVFGIARKTETLQVSMNALRNVLIFISGVSILLILVGIWWFTKIGIRPVEVLGDKIRSFSSNRLSDRVDFQVPTELQIIKQRLNEYLERIQLAFERERSFNHDVAHELKTPLAAIKAKIELSLRKQRTTDQYASTLQELQLVSGQLETIVGRMLELASLEQGKPVCEVSTVQIDQQIRDIWEDVSRDSKSIQLQWDLQQPCQWETDPVLVHVLLQNLLRNAFTYCNPGGKVDIRCSASEEELVLDIANEGSDLQPEDIKLIFSRFWRKSSDRQLAEGYCGLGLTISKRIVDCLEGKIEATSQDGIFRIVVRLPKYQPATKAVAG